MKKIFCITFAMMCILTAFFTLPVRASGKGIARAQEGVLSIQVLTPDPNVLPDENQEFKLWLATSGISSIKATRSGNGSTTEMTLTFAGTGTYYELTKVNEVSATTITMKANEILTFDMTGVNGGTLYAGNAGDPPKGFRYSGSGSLGEMTGDKNMIWSVVGNTVSSSNPVKYTYLPSERAAFEAYEEASDHPPNVTMHLFDYWVTEYQFGNDTITDIVEDKKINVNHALKFVNAIDNQPNEGNIADFPNIIPDQEKVVEGSLNDGTSFQTDKASWNARPRQGVVKGLLGEDGYPVLSGENHAYDPSNLPEENEPNISPQMFDGLDALNKSESLAYLFDPHVEHEGKKSFRNVTGLFQLDNNGYYYYNSMEENAGNKQYNGHPADFETANYAWFDEDNNRFRLYKSYGVLSKTEDVVDSRGQFFPFDSPGRAFKTDAGGAPLEDKLTPNEAHCRDKGDPFNHYFGLYLEIPFVQAPGGKVYYNGLQQDTIFQFSGDDDLWLYVDDVLVGDLGGVHGAATLDINFATGAVKINGGDNIPGKQTTNLKEIYKRVNKNLHPRDSDASTYADGSRHTIRIFYMERGNSASNLGIKFNLTATPVSKLVKYDEDGQTLSGAEFSLYTANKDGDGNYTIKDSAPIYKGTTNENGEMSMVNGTEPIVLSNLPGNYFILRETKTPPGYSSGGDMHLRKYTLGDNSVTLISDPDSPTGSKWNTGSYAAAVKTTNIASNDVYLRSEKYPYGKDTTKQVVSNNTLGGLDGNPGTMFAMVLKWTDATRPTEATVHNYNNSTPVYGTPEKGYQLANKQVSYNAAVLEALQANPYLFARDTITGQYSVTIDNLPGDITQYLHEGTDLDDLHYIIMYGWTDLTEDEIKGTTPINAAGHQFHWLYSEDFERTFAVTFKAVNARNDFHVYKKDHNDNPMSGVDFSLYKAADVMVNVDGTYSVKKDAIVCDVGTTGSDGRLSFPGTGKNLPIGEYYLIETPPAGYEPIPPVRMILDHTGVYAHAGLAGDGIQVEYNVGNIVKTMHEFGMDNAIDETLHNIIYKPQKSNPPTGPDNSGKWTFQWQDIGGEPVHLYHNPDTGKHGFVDKTKNPRPYLADEGWNRIEIQQCSVHTNTEKANKEELDNRDISNLFTREVTVILENEPAVILPQMEGIKTLTGATLKADAFTFRLQGEAGAPMPKGAAGNPMDVRNSADGRFRFGTITFKTPGVYVYTIREVIPTVPKPGYTYDNRVYTLTVTVETMASGGLKAQTVITEDGTVVDTITFDNSYQGPLIEERDPTVPDSQSEETPPTIPSENVSESAPLPGTSSEAVATGDDTQWILYGVLLVISLCGIVAIVSVLLYKPKGTPRRKR